MGPVSWCPGAPRGLGDRPPTGRSPAAHLALGTQRKRSAFFEWLGSRPEVADVADWVLPSIRLVLDEYRALPPVTWGTLHTDPAPEAFLDDSATGEVGIIDWSGACEGPILYDVASAVMYLGGSQSAQGFLEAYARAGVLPAAELVDHLGAFGDSGRSAGRLLRRPDSRKRSDRDRRSLQESDRARRARRMLDDLGALRHS